MAKTRIPRKIAGYKVPKAIRKSPMLKVLLGSTAGRRILSDAVMAGAAAAAAILVQSNEDVAQAGKKAAKGGKKTGNIAARAAKGAAGAMVNVIGEAAHAVLPEAMTDAGSKSVRRQAPRERRATH